MGGCCRKEKLEQIANQLEEGVATASTKIADLIGRKGHNRLSEQEEDAPKEEEEKKEKKKKKKKKKEDDLRFLDDMPRTEMQSYLTETMNELAEDNVINMTDLQIIYRGYSRSEIKDMFLVMYPDLEFEDDVSLDEADNPFNEVESEKKEKKKKKAKERGSERSSSKKKAKKKGDGEEDDYDYVEDDISTSPKKKDKKVVKEEKPKVGKENKPKDSKGDKTKGDKKDKPVESAIALGKSKKGDKDKEDLVLKVKVISGVDLRDADWGGKSDPFCVFQVLDGDGKSKFKGQTPVIEETLNPVWNTAWPVEYSFGDVLSFKVFDKDGFTNNLLGEYMMDSEWFYPCGFEGDVLLMDAHQDDPNAESYIKVKIDIKKDRTPGALEEAAEKDASSKQADPTLNFQDNEDYWRRAHHAANNNYEDDPDYDPAETTSSALNTIVRLAESGVHVPDAALEKVMRCLKCGDRRYRISALLICRALGKRMVPYKRDILEAFHDPDEGVRAAAIKVFASWDTEANELVLDIAKMTEDRMYEPRHAALETLAELCQSDCMQALVVIGHTLSSPDANYRLVTVKILYSLGIKATPQAYALSQMIKEDDSPQVRAECCKVLANLGLGANTVPDAIAALYRAEKDYDPKVRTAALEALKRLREEGRNLPKRPRGEDAPGKGGTETSPLSRGGRDRDRSQTRPSSARKGRTTRSADTERSRGPSKVASARRERPASRQ